VRGKEGEEVGSNERPRAGVQRLFLHPEEGGRGREGGREEGTEEGGGEGGELFEAEEEDGGRVDVFPSLPLLQQIIINFATAENDRLYPPLLPALPPSLLPGLVIEGGGEDGSEGGSHVQVRKGGDGAGVPEGGREDGSVRKKEGGKEGGKEKRTTTSHVPQQGLGRHQHQGLAKGPQQLSSQRMEILSRSCAVQYMHIHRRQ